MKNNIHKLKLNKKIYNKKAIKLAIQSFLHLAEFKIDAKNSYYIVKIKIKEAVEAEILIDEFANYVLYVMKNI